MRTYKDLRLYIADQKKPAIGCGYYYLVSHGGFSHTAFRTKKALKTWLKVTGLKIGKRCSNDIKLLGQYTSNTEMLNNDEFLAKHAGKKTFYSLCNGDYTIGFYEETENGNILHNQNPNTDRFVFEHRKVQEHLDTGIKMSLIY